MPYPHCDIRPYQQRWGFPILSVADSEVCNNFRLQLSRGEQSTPRRRASGTNRGDRAHEHGFPIPPRSETVRSSAAPACRAHTRRPLLLVANAGSIFRCRAQYPRPGQRGHASASPRRTGRGTRPAFSAEPCSCWGGSGSGLALGLGLCSKAQRGVEEGRGARCSLRRPRSMIMASRSRRAILLRQRASRASSFQRFRGVPSAPQN